MSRIDRKRRIRHGSLLFAKIFRAQSDGIGYAYDMEELVLPPQTAGGAGFESPRVRQFIVFLENRVGRLQQLLSVFETQKLHIAGLSIQESSDAALIRLICSDHAAGREALTASGFCYGESELLAIELAGESTKSLIKICSALLAAEINIHYAYPLLRDKKAALALYVDDPTLAVHILMRKQFKLIGESDLLGPTRD